MERCGVGVALCPQVGLFDLEGEGLKGLSHSGRRVPVKAQPVALEHTGELGPGVFQALQEVFLVERADPRGSLGGGEERGRSGPAGQPEGEAHPSTGLAPGWARGSCGCLGSRAGRAARQGLTFHGVMVLCRGIRLAM